MSEVIRVEDRYYILATSPLADDRTRVLKHGETFAVFDRYGDVRPFGAGAQGVFHEGTRFLSRMALRLGTERPLLLSSTVVENNALLAVDLTNPDFYRDGELLVPHGTVHLFRSIFLWEGVCYERLRVTNHGGRPVELALGFDIENDFADVFEVRGTKRKRRGRSLEPIVEPGGVVLSYRGLDEVTRSTRVRCTPAPRVVTGSTLELVLDLAPREERSLYLSVACERDGRRDAAVLDYDPAWREAMRALTPAASECTIYTSNEQFNAWLSRSMADLRMMVTETPQGPYPFAGVPWYSTVFGRDGIITALEVLWVAPDLGRGVLGYLAATQADAPSPEQDAEPGKILHEQRKGEMAAVGEIPFGSYYGSVDATPLFVLLAGAYYERTGDRALIDAIWPSIERALAWIDGAGDPDGDGLVEYHRHSAEGLVNQGWKDSWDAVFHEDGALAEGPIALCEVQGYVYAAKRSAAALARVRRMPDVARRLAGEAQILKQRFEQRFWCEPLGTYALALDGAKRQCRVRTSNAGHCLFTGIADAERAARLARQLFTAELFSGWGIRTVAATEARYNPMAYHNGSVWPHDNALIGWGLARYGLNELALRVLTGLFDASIFVDLQRLPELFCGFPRRPGEGPTRYPVACAPQSWAAASVFLLLQACLGLSIDAAKAQVRFERPVLPPFLETVEITGLRVGAHAVDLVLRRHPADVGIQVVRREGPVEIVTVK
jgi:glycogen debranching enzyme